MPFFEEPSWYAGRMSRTEAKDLVGRSPKHSFLVRASEEDHTYSLLVSDGKQANLFLIMEEEDGSCRFGSQSFKNLNELCVKIGKSGLKGKGGKLHVTHPIKKPVKEKAEKTAAPDPAGGETAGSERSAPPQKEL